MADRNLSRKLKKLSHLSKYMVSKSRDEIYFETNSKYLRYAMVTKYNKLKSQK